MRSLGERANEFIVQPLLNQLKQGTTPEALALCVGLGAHLGVIPMIGTTTALCALAAWALKLNQPTIQLVNYLVYPLQWILLLVWYKAGDFVFRSHELNFTFAEAKGWILYSPMEAISRLWTVTWHAVIAWLLLAPVVVGGFYFILVPLFRKAASLQIRKTPSK